jgi:ABC-type amino acid transport substrate-binding protein
MDDDRIERALRQGPPDEPVYAPRGLASRRSRHRSRFASLRPAIVLGATLLVVVAVALGAVILRNGRLLGPAATSPPTPAPTAGPALLEVVRARGVLRVAVAPTYPQVQIAGGLYDGFDIGVARAAAAKLGLQVEFTIVPEADIEAGTWQGRWDHAIGVPRVPGHSPNLAFGAAYAWWPAYVVVRDPAISAIAGLAGASACVARGSVPLDWLRGTLDPASVPAAQTPPAGATIGTRPTEADCLAAGDWGFTVTDRTLVATIAAQSDLHMLDAPAFIEPVAIAVDPAGPAADSFTTALDGAIAALRADGTLASISQQQLGGTDLTNAP